MFQRFARSTVKNARAYSTSAAAKNVVAATSSASARKLALAMAAATTLATTYTLNNSQVAHAAGAGVPPEGVYGTTRERTFIAIKPDGVNRQLIAKIIARFEEKGFQLVAIKMIKPTQELAAGHYDDLKSKPFFQGLVRYFSSGPIIAMVWQGKDVIKTGRVLLGATNPAQSAPGTIRGDYSIEVGRNIIHGSDGQDSAKHEINFWFSGAEVVDWQPALASWTYEKPT